MKLQLLSWLKRQITFMLLFLGLCTTVYSQNNTVTGTVTDQENEGLPGVTVLVQGTTRGTITDVNGKYAIEVNANEKLHFPMSDSRPRLST